MPWGLSLEEIEIDLQPGDILIQYTDGITEAKSKQGEEFGIERLCETIEQHGRGDAKILVQAVCSTVAEFAKGTQPDDADDITLLIVKIKDES